jgi:hypothetical protein
LASAFPNAKRRTQNYSHQRKTKRKLWTFLSFLFSFLVSWDEATEPVLEDPEKYPHKLFFLIKGIRACTQPEQQCSGWRTVPAFRIGHE